MDGSSSVGHSLARRQSARVSVARSWYAARTGTLASASFFRRHFYDRPPGS
ncbi:hypothetical protein IscW_ISCW021357 [Ixodes scapularis]|uniref:Uncharacterized protein n=1 Tax=Ixodes scapularis TaxID=6945 RepID=B7Q580_IXOSC|nr:hypothetical protein IscW_ISCW021357 [Ixodes scapularis]|eukprot:XP_002411709.1 hypothetical protein IscW_ISCW021357 [Ixodes scapularis]